MDLIKDGFSLCLSKDQEPKRGFLRMVSACLPPIKPLPGSANISPHRSFSMNKAILALLLSVPFADAEELQILERGPHHQVVKKIQSWVDGSGQTRYRTNRFTELANGLCYQTEGPNKAWELSREEFQVFENGFVANQGPLKVTLSANINVANAIDVRTPDGQHFEISPVFIGMRDGTGQSVVVSEIQPARGQLIAPNTVFYDGAFPGGGIRLVLTRTGIEQDCIIFGEAEARLSPADYGLNPESAVIELWSEFVSVPEGAISSISEGGVAVDVELNFGSTRIGAGRGFAVDSQEPSIPVRKSFGSVGNRQFLVEKVAYRTMKPFLDQINGAAVGKPPKKVEQAVRNKPVKTNQELLAQLGQGPREKRVASIGPSLPTQLLAFDWKARPGFVIDFLLGTTGNLTNHVFKADSTYFISGLVTCSGTTVFEGASVLKYTNAAQLRVTGPVDWRGKTACPVIMTSMDDASVGEVVRTNALSGRYANVALDLDGNASGVDFVLRNLRVSHATNGVRVLGGTGHSLSHAQFVNCQNGVSLTNAVARVRNALFYNLTTAFTGNSSTGLCEQLTVDAASALNDNSSGLALVLTNSLLTAVADTNGHVGVNVTSLASSAGVYQTVGAGAHYLAPGSPYRSGGATGINPQLAEELRKLTTYAPKVLSSSKLMTSSVTYGRVVPRATVGNALGYHYDPIDYAVSGVYALDGTTINVQPGVVFAGYNDGASGSYIFLLDYGAKLKATGTVEQPCQFVWYNSVQEQANANWQGEVGALVARTTYYSSAPSAELSLRFTDWVVLGHSSAPHLLSVDYDTSALPTVIRDSSFHGGAITWLGSQFHVTNCLLDRVQTQVWLDPNDGTAKATLQNSMVYGGGLYTVDARTNLFKLRDSVFYQAMVDPGGDVWDHGWNGYSTNGCPDCVVLAGATGTNVNTSLSFLSGPLGTFYQSTNSPLLEVGSTTANLLGLYHFTVITNQVKETNSVVDIGLHYPATASATSTVPLDGDGDGIPDYLEDLDGDGVVDAGETDWQVYNSKNGLGSAPAIVVFTQLR